MRLQYKWWETKSTVLVLCKNPFKSLSESYIRLQLSQWNQVDIVQGYVLFSVKFPLCGIAVGFLAQLLWRDRHFVLKIQIQSIVKSPLDLAMLGCWNLISTPETLWNSLTYRWKTVQSCFASCLYSYERHIQSETDTKYCMSVKCEATTCHQNRCNAVSATTLQVSGVYWCDDTAFLQKTFGVLLISPKSDICVQQAEDLRPLHITEGRKNPSKQNNLFESWLCPIWSQTSHLRPALILIQWNLNYKCNWLKCRQVKLQCMSVEQKLKLSG